MIGRLMALACSAALSCSILAGAPAQAATVQVEGGVLHYETCGSGPRALVLLHDGVLDSAGFDEIWGPLCKDFHVVRYDRRGYGRSPAAKAPYSPIDDLGAVMRAAGMEHATVAGFSAGGAVALDFALDHSAMVDRLVLAGASVDGFRTSDHFNKRNLHIALPLIIGNVGGMIANAAKDPYLIAPGHEAARQHAVELSKASPQNLRHQLHDPARPAPSALPRMPALTAPTLILVGDHDIADVQAMAGAAQALIPNSTRVVLSHSGHLMQLEQPREVVKLIGDFVRKDR